eukprot:11997260-Prorocentrum_lima.AAC.1
MTSSLVGSEMCIRDSIDDLLLEFELCELKSVVKKMKSNKAPGPDGVRICLLYTSDAADECRS